MEKKNSYPLQTILELACAAQRLNKDYIKVTEPVYSDDNKIMAYKWDNKILMLTTLDPSKFTASEDHLKPPLLCTNLEDAKLAEDIKKFYKRLLFSAIQGDNEFQTEVNGLLNSEEIPINKLGFIACLPSVYKRDFGRNQIEKKIKEVDDGWLGQEGELLLDKDCEVLACQRSKNFDAFNVDAIIDNKMVSWMSKYELNIGPAVIIKAKVKTLGWHWKYKQTAVTRINFVKAAQ
jgi:hypothetical protein